MKVGNVDLAQISGAFVWTGPLAIDADGSPNAYGPDDSGLDKTCEAGHPGNWWGVLTDADGNPLVQGENDPSPGKWISETALSDHQKAQTDPTRYVDAEVVPYISIPPELVHLGCHMGDVCHVVNVKTMARSPAVVADVGPREKLGEGSIALAAALGLDPSPRHGGCDSGILVILFPGSRRGWPRAASDVASQVEGLLAAWPGWSTITF